MAKKKQSDDSKPEDTTVPDFVDEIEGEAAKSEEPKKLWTKRPDPFGFETVAWPDGYPMRLMESDGNREIFIQFGSGGKDDQPQNFEAIKKMLKEEFKMYWDVKVQGWAKGLKQGVTPLIKEENRRIRTAVEEAFAKAIAMEEEKRGPALSDVARERGAAAR